MNGSSFAWKNRIKQITYQPVVRLVGDLSGFFMMMVIPSWGELKRGGLPLFYVIIGSCLQ